MCPHGWPQQSLFTQIPRVCNQQRALLASKPCVTPWNSNMSVGWYSIRKQNLQDGNLQCFRIPGSIEKEVSHESSHPTRRHLTNSETRHPKSVGATGDAAFVPVAMKILVNELAILRFWRYSHKSWSGFRVLLDAPILLLHTAGPWTAQDQWFSQTMAWCKLSFPTSQIRIVLWCLFATTFRETIWQLTGETLKQYGPMHCRPQRRLKFWSTKHTLMVRHVTLQRHMEH